jgi:hypothetical protein
MRGVDAERNRPSSVTTSSCHLLPATGEGARTIAARSRASKSLFRAKNPCYAKKKSLFRRVGIFPRSTLKTQAKFRSKIAPEGHFPVNSL